MKSSTFQKENFPVFFPENLFANQRTLFKSSLRARKDDGRNKLFKVSQIWKEKKNSVSPISKKFGK